jgi:hypothetical protein
MVIQSSPNSVGRRTETGEVLGVERAQRSFDSWPDAHDAFFDRWTEECDPELASVNKPGPAGGRWTSRMRLAIQIHSFHCRQGWIEREMSVGLGPVVPSHVTLRTQNRPFPDGCLAKNGPDRIFTYASIRQAPDCAR